MKTLRHHSLGVGTVLMVAVALLILLPAGAQNNANTTSLQQIVASTLAANDMVALSANGQVHKIRVQGQWLTVKEVELVNRTLIFRTDLGNLSLAAASQTP